MYILNYNYNKLYFDHLFNNKLELELYLKPQHMKADISV